MLNGTRKLLLNATKRTVRWTSGDVTRTCHVVLDGTGGELTETFDVVLNRTRYVELEGTSAGLNGNNCDQVFQLCHVDERQQLGS